MKNTGFMTVLWLACLIGFSAGSGTLTTASSAEISWRLENPLRYFSNAEDIALHRSIFDKLSGEEKRNPILSAERRLGRLYPRGWARLVFDRVCNGRPSANGGCDPAVTRVTPKEHGVALFLKCGGYCAPPFHF